MSANPSIGEPESITARWSDDLLLSEFIVGNIPAELGGAGSGHHGHKGIPGHQGGSLPSGKAEADPFDRKNYKFHTDWYLDLDYLHDQDTEDALTFYVGDGFEGINYFWRSSPEERPSLNNVLKEKYEETSVYLDGYLQGSRAKENFMAYRGASFSGSTEQSAAVIDALRTAVKKGNFQGMTFSDPGYLSSTVDILTAQRFVDTWGEKDLHAFFQIEVPKGTHVAPIAVGDRSTEAEVIFRRGTVFDIQNIKVDDAGVYVVKMRARP